MSEYWQSKKIAEVFQALNASESGLSNQEAAKRLKQFGKNILPSPKLDSQFEIFLKQFQSPLIYILLVAAAFLYLIGEVTDAFIIFIVLIFNAIAGSIQEGRAQKTIAGLRKFVETNTTVMRGGEERILIDADVVPGDVVFFQEGEKIPADARLIETQGLLVDESSLTGESVPIHKDKLAFVSKDAVQGDWRNYVFKGTSVLAGSGRALITATGKETSIGHIAQSISTIDAEMPIRKSIKELSRWIIYTVIAVSIFILIFGLLEKHSLRELIALIVSLSVSVIPEGLPIVVTIVLATGVWNMAKKNVLVKRLQAVEALGQAKIIALDKTGTITKNEMVVSKVYADSSFFEVMGEGYEPEGNIEFEGIAVDAAGYPGLLEIARIAMLSSRAHLVYTPTEKIWKLSGDPTDAAMMRFSGKAGFHKEKLDMQEPMLQDMPFTSRLKYHASLHKRGKRNSLDVCGAPEVVLELCKKIWKSGKSYDLDQKGHKEIEVAILKMLEQGLRVIACAQVYIDGENFREEDVRDLVFVGLFGMQDSLRSEVKDAIKKTEEAGVRVVMITGDHKVTAVAIAREAGIFSSGDIILTGSEIDTMSDMLIEENLPKASVFARVTPEHKLKIIQMYRKLGYVVAMTGDGINDAPSLVAADLGIAMGKIGTEVAKDASDIVLLDDNFENIVSAIEEGRSIYKTLKKVILYLFSTSLGEIFTIFGAIILGYPLPITPAQIVWLNFITDGFLDVSLAMEPKEEGILSENQNKKSRHLIDKTMALRMLVMAIPMSLGSLYVFRTYYSLGAYHAFSATLTTLAVFQWLNAWNSRNADKSIFQMEFLSNPFLAAATAIIISLQIFVLYNPFMRSILHTTPLSLGDWIFILLISSTIVIAEETRKLIYRKWQKI